MCVCVYEIWCVYVVWLLSYDCLCLMFVLCVFGCMYVSEIRCVCVWCVCNLYGVRREGVRICVRNVVCVRGVVLKL